LGKNTKTRRGMNFLVVLREKNEGKTGKEKKRPSFHLWGRTFWRLDVGERGSITKKRT